jgi:chemotaxis family two-component system response regulator Rcp1
VTPTDHREILVIEDNPGDALLAREAFQEAGVPATLNVVGDGTQAIRYLDGEIPFEDRVLPDLILLDLKLPGKDGSQVLREVKEDPELRRIPILVLTTSAARQDVQTAYDLHANSYLRKPVTFEEFVELARMISQYWLGVVHLPRP